MFETYTRQMLQKLYDELLVAIRTGRRGDLLKRDFHHLADDAFEELRIQLWQYMRTMLPSEREAANEVARPILRGFTRIKTGLEGSVISTLLTDQEFDEKRKTLQYRFDVAQHHAWTLTATGTGAANEAKRIQEAIKAGYTHFKFVGPAPEREFCQIHFDKTYSVEEILALDNGHRLNPLYFRGGYNCRHTWVPVRGAGVQSQIQESQQQRVRQTTAAMPDDEWMTVEAKQAMAVLASCHSHNKLIAWGKKYISANRCEMPRFNVDEIRELFGTIYKLNQRFDMPKLRHIVRYRTPNNAAYRYDDSLMFGGNIVDLMNSDAYTEEVRREGLTPDQYHSFYLSRNLEDVGVHEMGHRLHIGYHQRRLDDLYDFLHLSEEWKRYATGRASHNPREYIAEMFSRYFHGASIPRDLERFFQSIDKQRRQV